MKLVDDILNVKNAVVSNWDDILDTSQQINKFISDGLEWLENPNNQKKIENSLKNLSIPVVDPAALKNAFDELKNGAAKTVDPVLSEVDTILKEDFGTEILVNFIIKKLSDVPNLPKISGISAESIRNIISTLFSGGISFSLKDFSNAPSVNDLSQTTEGTGENDDSNNASSTSHGNNDVPKSLLDGLQQTFETFIQNNESDIENILTGIEALVSQEVRTKLEASITRSLNELQSETLTTENILHTLETLVNNEISDSKTVFSSFLNYLGGAFQNTAKLMNDLLTSPIEDNSDLTELYKTITRSQTAPTSLEIMSLVVAIPLTLINNAIGKGKMVFPNSIFQSDNKNSNEDFSGIELGSVIITIMRAGCAFQNKGVTDRSSKIKLLTWANTFEAIDLIFEVAANSVSDPQNPNFTVISMNVDLWRCKFAARVALPGLAFFAKLRYYNKLQKYNTDLTGLTLSKNNASDAAGCLNDFYKALSNNGNLKPEITNYQNYCKIVDTAWDFINGNWISDTNVSRGDFPLNSPVKENVEKLRNVSKVNFRILLTQVNGKKSVNLRNPYKYSYFKSLIEEIEGFGNENEILTNTQLEQCIVKLSECVQTLSKPTRIGTYWLTALKTTFLEACNSFDEGDLAVPGLDAVVGLFNPLLGKVNTLTKSLGKEASTISERYETIENNLNKWQALFAVLGLITEMVIGSFYYYLYAKGNKQDKKTAACNFFDATPGIFANLCNMRVYALPLTGKVKKLSDDGEFKAELYPLTYAAISKIIVVGIGFSMDTEAPNSSKQN